MPTVTLCTDAFIGLARDESKNLGMPNLPLVAIKHPLGGESGKRVHQHSKEALEQDVLALTQEFS